MVQTSSSGDRSPEEQIGYLLKRFFNNSPELLVVNLLEHEQLDDEEIRRLKRLIDNAK